MKFSIFRTSDRASKSGKPPVPTAKMQARERTGSTGHKYKNVWWEIEIDDLGELLALVESLSYEKENPPAELVLQSCKWPYDEDQPKYALEIVDDYRD